SSQREIIVGHVRLRRPPSGTSTRRVIAGQVHDLQRRQTSLPYEFLKLFQPHDRASLVHDVQIVCWILATGVTIERGLNGAISSRFIRVLLRRRLSKLAVIPERQAFLDRRVPEIAKRGLVHIAAIVSIASIRIERRNRLLAVIRDVTRGAPNVSLRTDLG